MKELFNDNIVIPGNFETIVIKSNYEKLEIYNSHFIKIRKCNDMYISDDGNFLIYSEHDLDEFDYNFKISYNLVKLFVAFMKENNIKHILILNDEISKIENFKDIFNENDIKPIVNNNNSDSIYKLRYT